MPPIGISFVDIAIIVGYLLLTLWLGFWVASKSTSLSDLLVGGRSLPWYALLGSIIATETSAVTFLSVPGLTFFDSGNMQFLQLVLGFVLGRVIAAYWLLPSFFAGSRFSAYEVLRNRFGGAAQKIASILFLLTRTVSDGLRLYLTAIVLAELMQCSMTLALCVMTVVTLIYSATGGIRSIVWNDCLQLIIYLGGALFALWLIIQGCDGTWNEAMTRGWELGKFRWLDLTPSLRSENLWVGLVGGAFLSLATHGTDQMMVQRYLSAKSLKDARLALLLCGPAVLLQFILFLMVGIGLWAFYQVHPPATILTKDRAFAYFIIHEMPIGIRGLTLAAVLSVAMSTLSSSVGSSASTFVTDLWISSKGNAANSTTDTPENSAELQWVCRVATVVFGLLQLLVALAVAWIPQLQVQSIIEQVLTFSGFASGIVLGVFLLTIRKSKMSPWSLAVGMLIASAVTSLAVFAPDEALWKVRGTLSAVIASLTTAGVAIVYQTILDLYTSTRPHENPTPKA
jgi:solute:Na+ symporter, SSS family